LRQPTTNKGHQRHTREKANKQKRSKLLLENKQQAASS